jgi:hypothetical protein
VPAPADMLQAVAMIPGTGEYALSTTPVHFSGALGAAGAANVSAEGGLPDFTQSLETLHDTLPNLTSVSLIYCWFGDDLRAGRCTVKPKVETRGREGAGQPWSVGGLSRAGAEEIARDADDRPVYGGTPCDAGVIEAIPRDPCQGCRGDVLSADADGDPRRATACPTRGVAPSRRPFPGAGA